LSKRVKPYENALVKNFFAILKSEYINRYKISTYIKAGLLINGYMDFYNNERTRLKIPPSVAEGDFICALNAILLVAP
jgi:hypothetical protein